jgi:hypothetical protein
LGRIPELSKRVLDFLFGTGDAETSNFPDEAVDECRKTLDLRL